MASEQYTTYWLQDGPPRQGTASALAGVAEPGDHLMVTGHGEYINVGTKAAPDWQPYVPKATMFIITAEG